MLLYADDAVVFATSPDALQSLLYDIETYCITWGLKINTAKTKIMIFERGRHTKYNFTLNNTTIEVVDSFKYLGIIFFKNGNWNRTQKRLANHASFALHNLLSLFNQIELPISQKCKLFDTLVTSILCYSAEVWGMHEAKDIELLHTKFCRRILGVKQSTNLVALYGELGRFPFTIIRKLRMLKYWQKILKMNNNMLTKKVYYMLKNDVDSNNFYINNSNWASQIKKLLDNLGFSDIWIYQFEIDIPFDLIKQRLLDSYKQSWYSDINNSNRLETYCRFKHNFNFEKYLDTITDSKLRRELSKFRLSSHQLAIEKGRYNNTPRDQRKCTCCNQNVIENEYHFLLVCQAYRQLRLKYFKPYFCSFPTLNKFDILMTSNSNVTLLNISKYLLHASKLRHDLLNQ